MLHFNLELGKENIAKDYFLEILAEDQEQTLKHLKNGLASIALSSSNKKIRGVKNIFLGSMEYLLVASPSYLRKFDPSEPHKFFKQANGLRFDQNDQLQQQYLTKYFSKETSDLEISYHYLPSTQGFKKLTVDGNCYALLPKMDIIDEIQKEKLIEIFPNKRWKIPLYLHHWDHFSNPFYKIQDQIIKYAKRHLY